MQFVTKIQSSLREKIQMQYINKKSKFNEINGQ